jgi:hypothetical protein
MVPLAANMTDQLKDYLKGSPYLTM